MGRKSVCVGTIGCRLNQYETDLIKRSFVERGYTVVPEDAPADIAVVNTCTVTGRSDYRSRQLVRRLRRRNSAGIVIVTGCYAQNEPEAAASIPGVDMVVGNAAKLRLPDLIQRRNGRPILVLGSLPTTYEEGPETRGRIGGRTRAFLKIQDGCDQACAYCAVRLARGPSRSRPWDSILGEAEAALGSGYRELVLTGVNLGSYGRDLAETIDLAGVVERLASLPGVGRIRLSSVEPQEVTDALVELVGSHPRVCRHLHLPLQSGSDPILARMNRSYGREDYARLVERITERVPDCGLGADVMVGFPGETPEDFRSTVELVCSLPVSYLHVFSYSPRAKTPASAFGHGVSGDDKKARSRELRRLALESSLDFRRRFVGKRLSILVETTAESGLVSGLSDNYIRVEAEGDASLVNRLIEVRVTEANEGGSKGVVVGGPGDGGRQT